MAGEVSGFDPLQWIPRKLAAMTDRFAHFGLAAAQMAIDDSGLDLGQVDKTGQGCWSDPAWAGRSFTKNR